MPRTRRLPSIAALAVPAVALVVAGCGGDDDTAQATPSQGSSAESGGGHVLHLSADPAGALEFSPMSLSAKAGKVTLKMKNPPSSGLEHGIAIEGNGVDKDGAIVAPGGTSKVTVSLKPGTYRYYCPFDSHEEEGMTGTLTVR